MKYSGQSTLTKIFQLIKSKFDSLATVATSGSYNDLIDKPELGTVVRGTFVVSDASTQVINIPISIASVDNLVVYVNGLLMTSGVHYTATTTSITLMSYYPTVGDIFTFIGSTTDPGTNTDVQATDVLFQDTTNYEGCSNVYDALESIATKEGNLESQVSTLSETVSSQGSTMQSHADSSTLHLSTSDRDTLDNALPKSGGTMTGALVAQTNTNYTTRQVRNVIISTSEPTSSDGQNGDIWIVYEA